MADDPLDQDLDLHRRLDGLTRAATRTVVVPPADAVRARARAARRGKAISGAATLAVVAIVAVALWAGPERRQVAGPAASTSTGAATPTTSAPSTSGAGAIPATAMLAPGSLAGSGRVWTVASDRDDHTGPVRVPSELDPCGEGLTPPGVLAARMRTLRAGDTGEIVEQVWVTSSSRAKTFLTQTRDALTRCRTATPGGAAGEVTYVPLEPPGPGDLDGAADESLMVQVASGASDPFRTYATLIRVKATLILVYDFRVVAGTGAEAEARKLAKVALQRFNR